MSAIKLPLLFVGSAGEGQLSSLFSSGSNLSWINPKVAKKLGLPVKLERQRQLWKGIEGHFIEIADAVRLDFYLNDVLLSDEFLLVPGLSDDAIIGAAKMQKWRIKLDFEHDTVFVDPKAAKMQLI